MTDYIDRQAAIDAVIISSQKWDRMYIQDLNCRLRDALNALPSAEVEPVKRGKWQLKMEDVGTRGIPFEVYSFHCSVCGVGMFGRDYVRKYHYCPNCGAKNGEEK